MDEGIFDGLISILERTKNGVRWDRIVRGADPDEVWKISVQKEDPYWTRLMLSAACQIRHIMVVDFPNYRVPARFKEKVA